MKFLLDFDGTLTNIQHEYQFIREYLTRRIETCAGIDKALFDALYHVAWEHIAQEPEKHGWIHNGRISAFCDEDLFMNIAAVMQCLDDWMAAEHPAVSGIAGKMKNAGVTFVELTEEAHMAMNQEPLCAFNTPEPEVVNAIRVLLDRDCEIVVASNSPASRIIPKFEHVGLKPVDHDDNPSARFRIRGNAGKFILGDHPKNMQFGSRVVDVDHPAFAKIIAEERPQVMIGDVFSLDLALPMEMARLEPMIYEDMQLYLRVRPYTPQWAIDCALNPEPGCPVSVRLLNHFADLPALVLKR